MDGLQLLTDLEVGVHVLVEQRILLKSTSIFTANSSNHLHLLLFALADVIFVVTVLIHFLCLCLLFFRLPSA